MIVPNAMVIDEEFGDWSDSRRRIDLLCLKQNGNLVIVELKRTEDGGHMELQAIRYAAMISKMRFAQAVDAHQSFLARIGIEEDAKDRILKFLDLTEPSVESFNQQVEIVLASAEFSKELTTSVIWLNTFGIDVKCVRLKPHVLEGKTLWNVEQIIPVPEAADYQVKIREKEKEEREARSLERDLTRFQLKIADVLLQDLPKRRLAFHIVKLAIKNGADPKAILQNGRSWIIVDGTLNANEFERTAEVTRAADSSTADFRRFFTEDDELFHYSARTYALTNQWGASTLGEVKGIIDKFYLTGIEYSAMEEI
jgi:hypothetical protein